MYQHNLTFPKYTEIYPHERSYMYMTIISGKTKIENVTFLNAMGVNLKRRVEITTSFQPTWRNTPHALYYDLKKNRATGAILNP